MRSIQTAVVTGPTGAIGWALCARLLRAGVRVFAVCRLGSPRAERLRELDGVERVFCDAAEFSRLPELLPSGADAFFHLAWAGTAGPGRNDNDAQLHNIQATLEACRAAAILGCRVFVGAGSQAEYGRVDQALASDTPCFPETAYGMAKLCAGQMSRLECKKLGLAHVWPRILSVYGPYCDERSMLLTVIRSLLNGETPALTEGAQLWDYLYSDDAAEALYLLARSGRDGGVYPLGSGGSKPLRNYLVILRNEIDPSLPLGFGKLPYREDQLMCLEANIEALKQDTGFVPRTDFTEGIKATIAWVKGEKQT